MLRFSRSCKNQTKKSSHEKHLNVTVNFPCYISILWYSWLLFLFILLLNLCQLYESGRVNIVSMFRFLETDIREQKRYEKRIQTSVDNTVNDLHYEIKFENCVKDKNNLFIKRKLFFFKQKYILFLQTYFCKIPKNLIAEADTKKQICLSKSLECCTGKTHWLNL